jgi:hypothetical protein
VSALPDDAPSASHQAPPGGSQTPTGSVALPEVNFRELLPGCIDGTDSADSLPPSVSVEREGEPVVGSARTMRRGRGLDT